MTLRRKILCWKQYDWQGPPSEGCKGEDNICQEKEGNVPGKETTQVREEIMSGERGISNSARTETATRQQTSREA